MIRMENRFACKLAMIFMKSHPRFTDGSFEFTVGTMTGGRILFLHTMPEKDKKNGLRGGHNLNL
jgi:hypothetical protein